MTVKKGTVYLFAFVLLLPLCQITKITNKQDENGKN
ncbi:hypothetical protein EZS27_003585 [termite gut metagenome]|uniref:Uncharacterized protein n=1 Tax=termite gut metagenome TaxID=433724 RepID=A0A5J4SUV7_9ZZZZ